MTHALRLALPALALALAPPPAAQAGAAAETFTTAAGVTVRTPPLEGLGCAEMRRVLDGIDASGYRRGAPRPEDEADMALLDYENRLSRAFYARCVQAEAAGSAPTRAFVEGYAGAAAQ